MGVSRVALVGMECKFVTEECVKEWKATTSPRKLHLAVSPARFMYELCWTVVRGELPPSKCRVALDAVDLTEAAAKEETASIVADTIAHMGQELVQPGELRTRLIELAKWLVDSGLVPVRLLQERCEAEFLWEAEMIKIKAPDLKSKEVRVNTRLLYQQTKFNLLREESEGYAKLITLLSQRGPDGLTHKTAPVVISTLKSLIGHFDLDPNRVFDIVLECFELQPENEIFLELIPLFPKSHISHILGFKFQYYQRSEIEDPVPSGLYRLAATLIKAKFIDLDSIYAHLLPKDEEAIQQYEEITKKRTDEANKIGKINLAATGRDLMEEEKAGDVTIDLYAALDTETEAVAERGQELLINQKLGLLNGFLCVDDWLDAHVLFDRLAALSPVAHPTICAGLSRAIEKAIQPIYSQIKHSSGGKSNAISNGNIDMKRKGSININKDVFQMLSCIGPYLHRDVILLQKVCRVLRGYYSAAVSTVQNSVPSANAHENGESERRDARLALKEARIRVEDALGSCLLPSLQLLPANPAVGLEIWEVMSLLPYEVRYRLYGEWEKEDEQIPMLLAARQTARLDTRRILKRLAKENLKQLGRMVAKLAHANPMTVLRTIVNQIEAYKDMIAPVVDAFKFLNQLEYDILEYVVIERLAQGGREKIKEDGLNISDWLQSLASFWGHLCKKYPSMELRGLFQYLVNQLKKGEGVELVVLQELVQQMASVEFTENMTEDQLEAIAGGEALRYQATAFGVTRNNKALLKSTNRLRDSLLSKDDPKLAVPLLLLIAQHRSIVVVNADVPHIKMVSEQYDRCHGILLQYIEFLTSAVSPVTAYAQLIPTLEDLVHKYHIEPEVAFLVYRPVMHLFKPSKNSTFAWPSDTSKVTLDLEKKQSGDGKVSNDLILDVGQLKKTTTWSELLETVHSMLPAKAWNSLSPELYATFWGLTLHDLYVPQKRYEAEISKQRSALKALEENSDNSNSAIARRKKEKEKIQEILDRLKSELSKQEQNVASVHARLVQEKDSWLTSCPDSLKINMEFLQRCIFPRCVFSMMDAVYCARFVYTLHSMGTPFFNTVNHIDVLICKTLQPMISSCTEFEAGRLGRFLCETLKMAYYWKSSESLYEEECGNKPGFAVLYRDPNSPRVTFAQYIRVHWKWSSRLTKLIIQCLESTEYMEIRNALTVLTKISSVFPVMKKSGVNIERRVSKIKGDEREDLKVLAIGVTAALATRKNAWVSEEEFGMGYIDVKPTPSPAKVLVTPSVPLSSSATPGPSPLAVAGGCTPEADASNSQAHVTVTSVPSQETASESATKRTESSAVGKSDQPRPTSAPTRPSTAVADTKVSLTQASTAAVSAPRAASAGSNRSSSDLSTRLGPSSQGTAPSAKMDDTAPRQVVKQTQDSEARRRPSQSSSTPSQGTAGRPIKSELSKEESAILAQNPRAGGPGPTQVSGDRDTALRSTENVRRSSSGSIAQVTTNGSAGILPTPSKAPTGSSRSGTDRGELLGRSGRQPLEHLSRSDSLARGDTSMKLIEGKGILDRERFDAHELGVAQRTHAPSKSPSLREDISKAADDVGKDRTVKRTVAAEDAERLNKRRKGDTGDKNDTGEMRLSDRDRGSEQRLTEGPRSLERDRIGYDDRTFDRLRDERPRERSLERVRDRIVERGERDYRVLDRALEKVDRDRVEDYVDRLRDRSSDRFTAERLVDRGLERSAERGFDRVTDRSRDERGKDDRGRTRLPSDQPLINDRYTPTYSLTSTVLPPPAPLPPHVAPLPLPGGRSEDDGDRRMRSVQRVSPSRDERMEKRRLDESSIMVMDESKRRREEEIRERKREEREMILKAEKDREREKEKAILLKEEAEGASKRRRLKRGDLASGDPSSNFGPPPVPVSSSVPQGYDSRDRDRKGVLPRNMYVEESAYEKGQAGRSHAKDGAKLGRREHEMFDRDWEEEKRQRGDMKRRHHRK